MSDDDVLAALASTAPAESPSHAGVADEAAQSTEGGIVDEETYGMRTDTLSAPRKSKSVAPSNIDEYLDPADQLKVPGAPRPEPTAVPQYTYAQTEIRFIGLLNIWFGCIVGVAGALGSLLIFVLVLCGQTPPDGHPNLVDTFFGLFGAVVAGGFPYLYGKELRDFRPWTWYFGVFNSIAMLFGFPCGTLLGAYLLWVFIRAREDFSN